jgi:WD40 repeat protein
LSGDEKYALSGSRDTTLKLWEVASGRCLRTFEGHTDEVKSVCLSVDGRFALSGSWDKTLKLWETANGKCLRTYHGHTDYIASVCLSIDGKVALSGSYDGTMRLWDVESGKCLRSMETSAMVFSADLSGDGRHAVCGCSDGSISLWFLDWELEENEPADWDEGARPYLDVFLRGHRPYGSALPRDRQPTDEEVTRALTRRGKPEWSEEDFQGFLYTLGCAGYGWLRPEGVRQELEKKTVAWSDVE